MIGKPKVAIFCRQCGKEFFVTDRRKDVAKYCSYGCMHKSQKGVKKPHSKEWEERRLEKVREANSRQVYRRGYTRPEAHTKPMRDGFNSYKMSNPEKFKNTSIKNLSKTRTLDLKGENSPQWAGGITKEWQKWRSAHGSDFEKFRKIVLKRDGGKCRICGSTEKIHAHHIISVAECRAVAFLPMNGVTLCIDCHKKTDSFGAKAFKKRKISSENVNALLWTIPHSFQAYSTAGNYQWTKEGLLLIFVSEIGNQDYEYLVMLHEYVEAHLCKRNGVTQKQIDDFDINFEKEREVGLHGEFDEPGDDKSSPYYKYHQVATKIERMMCKELGIKWSDYDNAVNSLS
jgi:hypothetical protein